MAMCESSVNFGMIYRSVGPLPVLDTATLRDTRHSGKFRYNYHGDGGGGVSSAEEWETYEYIAEAGVKIEPPHPGLWAYIQL